MMRNELLRMLSWQVGSAYGFTFSVGKNYKFIGQYLPAEQWQALLSTYRTDSVENTWRSLFTCHELFRDAAKNFAAKYGYTYPDYDENVSRYVREMYAEYEAISRLSPKESAKFPENRPPQLKIAEIPS